MIYIGPTCSDYQIPEYQIIAKMDRQDQDRRLGCHPLPTSQFPKSDARRRPFPFFSKIPCKFCYMYSDAVYPNIKVMQLIYTTSPAR